MFGSLNNLAHHCSVASFPPCWAAIPGTIARPVDAELSCAPEGRSDVPSCRMRKRMRKKEELLLLMVKDSSKASSVMWKKQREMEMNQISPLFLIFSPLFISCVSFLFAADKQHWLIYEQGYADATSSHPDDDRIQTLQKIHQVLERTIKSWWIASCSCEENADVFFLVSHVLLGEFPFLPLSSAFDPKFIIPNLIYLIPGADVGSLRIMIFSIWNNQKMLHIYIKHT